MDPATSAAALADLRTVHPLEAELPADAPSLVKRMSDELRCSVCLCTVTNPEQTPCNHLFCKDCITRSLQVTSSADKCPVCKTPVTRRALTAHDTLRETADAFRELKEAYEEEFDQSLSQAIPRCAPGGGEWKAEPLANLSQLFPAPQKPAQGSNVADGPAHQPSPAIPRRGRRRRGSGRAASASASVGREIRRSARNRSGAGLDREGNGSGTPVTAPVVTEVDQESRPPSRASMGRAGIASNTASQQRASLRMGLTPSGRENDSMSITGSPLDGLNKDRFDVTFPPLPDQTELLGLFTALDENVLVSLEGFILEKISAVESEIVSHEQRRKVLEDCNFMPFAETRETNAGEGQKREEVRTRTPTRGGKRRTHSAASSCFQTAAPEELLADISLGSVSKRGKKDFPAHPRSAQQRSKTMQSCHTPHTELTLNFAGSSLAKTRGPGCTAAPETKKSRSRARKADVMATFSMVKKPDAVRLKSLLADLGGIYSEDCGRGVTHIITHLDRNRRSGRTMKTLKGLLNGCWIVSEQWLEKSAEDGRFLDEEGYEAAGHVHSKAEDAPRRARISKAQEKPPLFRNQRFLLYGPFGSPSAEDLLELLELAGGTVDVDPARSWTDPGYPPVLPMNHSRQGSTTPSSSAPGCDDTPGGGDGRGAGGLRVVVPRNSPAELRRHVCRAFGVRPVADEWVLDSVGAFKVLPKKDYSESRIFDEALFDARFASGEGR